MARLKVSAGLFGLAMSFGLQGCATNEGGSTTAAANEHLDSEDAKALMFECKPEAGAPRHLIRIFKAAEVVNDAPEDKTDAVDEGDDEAKEAKEAVAEAKAVDPNVQAVRIELNDEERGIPGRCSRTAPYNCQATDESFRMAWPDKADAAAKVEVKEKWLLGTKTYLAGCKGQVL